MSESNGKHSDRSAVLIKAIDPYLPSGIRANHSLSLEGLIRSRVLTSILIIATCSTAFSLALCVLFHFVTEHDFSIPIIISLICFGIVGMNYYYFYKTAKLDSSAILYSMSFFAVIVVAIVLTGGYHSPLQPMLIVCPVVSFLISGRSEGVYNACLVFVVGTGLLILENIGFELLQIMPIEIMPYLSGIIWLVTVVLVVVCLYVYDVLLEDKRSIRAKSP